MVKFDTKLQMTTYLAKTNSREGKYVVLQDETMQNLKATYTFVNTELVLESGGTTVLNWRTPVANFAAVASILSPIGLDAVVVLADETHDNQPTQYIYSGYTWIYNGIYFKESLQIEVSERDARGSDIMLDTDYTLPLKYTVGSGHLEVFYDDVQLLRGADFVEVGTLATVSDKIQFMNTIPKEARLIFKRDIAGKYDETMSARKGKVDVYYFDTFTEAQNSPHLLDVGQVIRTFGHTTKNDGKGRYWILESTDKDFGYKNKMNTLFINRMINADELPIGHAFFLPGSEVAPNECVKQEGQIANRADFKRVWAWAVANGRVVTEAEWSANPGCFSSGDLSTTFRFPLAKDFIRAKESGRNVGSFQDDAIRNITGQFGIGDGLYGNPSATAGTGAFAPATTGYSYVGTSNPATRTFGITLDSSRVVPTATENRPKNIAQQYFIKV